MSDGNPDRARRQRPAPMAAPSAAGIGTGAPVAHARSQAPEISAVPVRTAAPAPTAVPVAPASAAETQVSRILRVFTWLFALKAR